MKIAAWIVTVLLLVASIACIVDALTTTHSVWLGIPMLVFSGVLLAPALFMLAALLGLYRLAIEVNGHRLDLHKRDADAD